MWTSHIDINLLWRCTFCITCWLASICFPITFIAGNSPAKNHRFWRVLPLFWYIVEQPVETLNIAFTRLATQVYIWPAENKIPKDLVLYYFFLRSLKEVTYRFISCRIKWLWIVYLSGMPTTNANSESPSCSVVVDTTDSVAVAVRQRTGTATPNTDRSSCTFLYALWKLLPL